MSTLYSVARARMLKATFDWEFLNVRMGMYTGNSYVFDESHEVLSQVGVPTAVSERLTGMVASPNGYARSDRAVFLAPPVALYTFIILYEDIGTDKPLIAYIDVGEGLPYMANGLDQVIEPDWIDERGWFRP